MPIPLQPEDVAAVLRDRARRWAPTFAPDEARAAARLTVVRARHDGPGYRLNVGVPYSADPSVAAGVLRSVCDGFPYTVRDAHTWQVEVPAS